MAESNGEMLDNVFQAIDTIVQKRISGLNFDKTLTCQIINIDTRDKGEYIVTDGSSTFKAYSEKTNYSLNSWVYVTIPNGDFNEKKLIAGKYIEGDASEYFTYVDPMEIDDTIYHSMLDIPKMDGEYIYGKNDNFALVIMLKQMLTDVEFKNFLRVFNTLSKALNQLFLGSGNTLYWPDSDNSLKGFRAYFLVSGDVVPANSPARLMLREDVSTAIDNPGGSTLNSKQSDDKCCKHIQSGQIVIVVDGVKYNMQGQPVR